MSAPSSSPPVEVLEIRVHGVSNTPPAEMLEADPGDVTRVVGDTLGSFWAKKADTPEAGVAATEAFSWGAQTRTGGGPLAAVGRALVHVGWLLLLPYALVNLAYWTREIRPQQSGSTRAWHGDTGSGTVRVFGLLLTLIAVTAFCSVAIDLVAVQCFRGSTDEADQVCAALPPVFDGLRAIDVDSRAALLGIVPIAVILILYAIGRRGRVRFEARIEKFGEDIGGTQEPGRPLLATRGFWAGARIRETSEWLHVAASLLLVVFLLAFDAAFPGADCIGAPMTKDLATCLGPVHWLPMGFAIAAGIGILLVVVGVILASSTPEQVDGAGSRNPLRRAQQQTPDRRNSWKRRYAFGCVALAAIAYVVWLALTFTDLTDGANVAPQFTGLLTAPIVLMAVALFLALYALAWRVRSPIRRRSSALVLTAAALALLYSQVLQDSTLRWALTGAAVLLVGVHLILSWMPPPSPRTGTGSRSGDGPGEAGDLRFQAWRGQGAAVVLLLSLFVSMALSSLLVLGVASWLGAPEPAETDGMWRTPAEPLSATEWNVPDAYERFAVLVTAVVLLTVIVLIAAAVVLLTRLVRFTLPALEWTAGAASDERDWIVRGGAETPGPGYPAALEDPAERTRIRAVKRRYAHLLHRGEPLFAWIAVFSAIGFFVLSSTVIFDSARAFLGDAAPGLPGGIRTVSTSILVGLAILVTAAVVANAASSGERPLGVFWDVVAFFPRAGHPFAPPCFAERAVPELAEHTRAFLGETTAGAGIRAPKRAVILTAHSMGSAISAATILALRGERVHDGPLKDVLLTDRVAFLSFGSQLRGYFSRFFPSVFGYRVLGVPGLLAPSLWQPDPWKAQVVREFGLDPFPPADVFTPESLSRMLSADEAGMSRWRNLWRRTDYLGFPVFSYRTTGNPIDRGATETAPGYMWKVATHADYLGVEQIDLVRRELAATFTP